ncbi:ribosomal protein S6 kinase beta-2-like isoform X1 [Vespula squamosa]|uniref:Ribosomal protein S6 kinase beta-2-like isoform X1 n=1 Tax=Vespula squamosa TaxID=30214 RepID=A0ABD2A3S1_VESSQ
MKSDVRSPPWDFDWAAFMLMHVRTGGAIYRDSTLFHESGVESRRQRRRRTRAVAGSGSGSGSGSGGGGGGISGRMVVVVLALVVVVVAATLGVEGVAG